MARNNLRSLSAKLRRFAETFLYESDKWAVLIIKITFAVAALLAAVTFAVQTVGAFF